MWWPQRIYATGAVLGIHILEPEEVEAAREVMDKREGHWGYVVVPMRLDQLDYQRWQEFFDKAQELSIVPIVRLASEIDGNKWKRPTRADVVEQVEFLSRLNWHVDKRRVIVYNEPNHAGEWGGGVDVEDYGALLKFAAEWMHTEDENYVVLPAGLDAAAPNGSETMDSLVFVRRMAEAEPEVLKVIDAWTSHSYPNPGFSASVYNQGKNGLWGFDYELGLVEELSGRELPVYITETGWDQTKVTVGQLEAYYSYSMEEIWSDERVAAVTPFILNGNNGLFEGFSFKRPDGSPSAQMRAWLSAVKELLKKS